MANEPRDISEAINAGYSPPTTDTGGTVIEPSTQGPSAGWKIPANLSGGAGIAVDVLAAGYSIRLDVLELEVGDYWEDTLWCPVWRDEDGRFYRVDFSGIKAGITALSESIDSRFLTLEADYDLYLDNRLDGFELSVQNQLNAFDVRVDDVEVDVAAALLAANNAQAAIVADDSITVAKLAPDVDTLIAGKVAKTGDTMTGKLLTVAPVAGAAGAGFNLPHGTAPGGPVNGDLWTTTTEMQFRMNGGTQNVAFKSRGQTWAGKQIMAASVAGGAMFNLTPGADVTSGQANGDIWHVTGTTQLRARLNGATYTLMLANDNISIRRVGAQVEVAASTAAEAYFHMGRWDGASTVTARWRWTMDNDAESTGNAGTTLLLERFSDAGALLGTPLQVRRSDGLVTLEGRPMWGGAVPYDNWNLSPYTFRNRLINGFGEFFIDQRNAIHLGKVIGAGVVDWICDRWLVHNHTNQSCTIVMQSGENGWSQLSINYAVAPTTGGFRLVQRIEDVRTLGNKDVAVSHELYNVAGAMDIHCGTQQVYGTGSITTTVDYAFPQIIAAPAINGWRKYQQLGHMPIVNGDIQPHNQVTMSWDWFIRQAGTFYLRKFQAEEGNVASPYEQRPRAVEEDLCQRYFQIHRNVLTVAGYAAGPYFMDFPLPTRMRVDPSVAFITRHAVSNSSQASLNLAKSTHVRLAGTAVGGGLAYSEDDVQLSAEL